MDLIKTVLACVIGVTVSAIWLISVSEMLCQLHSALERGLRKEGRGLALVLALIMTGVAIGVILYIVETGR